VKRLGLGLLVICFAWVVFISATSQLFAKTKAPVNLSFWFPSSDKKCNEYFIDAAKEFEKTHPQIKVTVAVLPPGQADVDLKLNAAMLSGTYPDVLSAFLSSIGTRGSQGDFYPLEKYVAKWKDKTDMYPNMLGLGKYKNKLLGLAYYPNPDMLVYRKDFFKEAGLDPNQPPANWNELAAYAKKLTVYDANKNVARAGLDIPALNSNVFIKAFCRQNGANVIDDKRQKPMLNAPGVIEAFNFIMKLKNEKVSIPYNYIKKDSIPFLYGRSAMSFLQPTQIAGLLDSDKSWEDKLGLAPVLTGKKKSAFCGSRLFTIGNSSKHKDKAWEFIMFMMSTQQMTYRYKELKIPVVRKSLEDGYIAADSRMNRVILDYVKNGQGDNVVPWNTLATKYFHQAYEEAYNGVKTPSKALNDAQAALVKEIRNIK
jgi:ABC-type glycerol-3-phosphate transport system substrate-binding protein